MGQRTRMEASSSTAATAAANTTNNGNASFKETAANNNNNTDKAALVPPPNMVSLVQLFSFACTTQSRLCIAGSVACASITGAAVRLCAIHWNKKGVG